MNESTLFLRRLGLVILWRFLLVGATASALYLTLILGSGYIERGEGLSAEAVDFMFFLYLFFLSLLLILFSVVCSWFLTERRRWKLPAGVIIGVLPMLLFVLSAVFSFYFEERYFAFVMRRISGFVGDVLQIPGASLPRLWGLDIRIFDPGLDDATVILMSTVFACTNALSWVILVFLLSWLFRKLWHLLRSCRSILHSLERAEGCGPQKSHPR